jgi:hypothetical protein
MVDLAEALRWRCPGAVPATGQAMGRLVRRLAPEIAAAGLVVLPARSRNGGRRVTICRAEDAERVRRVTARGQDRRPSEV